MTDHEPKNGAPGVGDISVRYNGRGTSLEAISAFLTELVTTDPRNVLPEGDNPPIWDPPVVGIASASDPLFTKLKEPDVVGAVHADADFWLPGAKSVVSFFLPSSTAVKKSYGKHDRLPSLEWVSTRQNGEVFLNLTRRALARYLQSHGGRAMAPNLDLRYRSVDWLPMWSERHVAYIAGVGTFGLHAGLLTEKGAAGRIGSVVTDLELKPTKRAYTGIYDYCPWFTDGSCGACIHRCPVGAIHENGKDHKICITNGRDTIVPAYGAWNYHSCGHCQNNLPCSDSIPPRALQKKTAD